MDFINMCQFQNDISIPKTLTNMIQNTNLPSKINYKPRLISISYILNHIYGYQMLAIEVNSFLVRKTILRAFKKHHKHEISGYIWQLNAKEEKIRMVINMQNGYIYFKYHIFLIKRDKIHQIITQMNKELISFCKIHLPIILRMLADQPDDDDKLLMDTLKSYINSANKYAWFNEMTNLSSMKRLQHYKASKQLYSETYGEISGKYGPNNLVRSLIKAYKNTKPENINFSIPSDNDQLKLVEGWIKRENEMGKSQSSQIVYVTLKKETIKYLQNKWNKFSDDYLLGKRQQHQKFKSIVLDTVQYGKIQCTVEFIFVKDSFRHPLIRERSIMMNIFDKQEHMNIAKYIYPKQEHLFNICTRFIALSDYISFSQFISKNSLTIRNRSKLNIIFQLSKVALYMRQNGIVFNNLNPQSIRVKKRIVKIFDMRYAYHKKFENREREWEFLFPYRTNQKIQCSEKSDVVGVLMLIYLLLVERTPYFQSDPYSFNNSLQERIPFEFCFECVPGGLRMILQLIMKCFQNGGQQIIYLDWLHIIIRTLCNHYKI